MLGGMQRYLGRWEEGKLASVRDETSFGDRTATPEFVEGFVAVVSRARAPQLVVFVFVLVTVPLSESDTVPPASRNDRLRTPLSSYIF
jgi:hypothetical protein